MQKRVRARLLFALVKLVSKRILSKVEEWTRLWRWGITFYNYAIGFSMFLALIFVSFFECGERLTINILRPIIISMHV